MVHAEGEVHNTAAVVGIGIGMAGGEAPVRPASAGLVAGVHVHVRSGEAEGRMGLGLTSAVRLEADGPGEGVDMGCA